MSKFKKKFRDYYDDESNDYDDYIEQKSRKKLKKFERALKSRNIDELMRIEDEEEDYY